ncbi:Uncharacterized protein Fot_24981 [Forsythia ovata]|uniref:Uncharacterized protein n=1 Tax=Forsythia ovata TaxID=205694 RepID=A0ABD1U8W5_9LAMI
MGRLGSLVDSAIGMYFWLTKSEDGVAVGLEIPNLGEHELRAVDTVSLSSQLLIHEALELFDILNQSFDDIRDNHSKKLAFSELKEEENERLHSRKENARARHIRGPRWKFLKHVIQMMGKVLPLLLVNADG